MESLNRIALDNIESQQQELSNLRQYKDDLMAKLNDLKANRQSLLRTPSKLNEYIDCIDKIVECFDYRLNKTEMVFLKMAESLSKKREFNQSPVICKDDHERTSSIDQVSANCKINIKNLVDKLTSFLCENNIEKYYFIRYLFGKNVNTTVYFHFIFTMSKFRKWNVLKSNSKDRFKKIHNFLTSKSEVEVFLNKAKIDKHLPRKQRLVSLHKPMPNHSATKVNTQKTLTNSRQCEFRERKYDESRYKTLHRCFYGKKSKENKFKLAKHKEAVLRKYFSFNRYPDQDYKANNQFHKNACGFDFLSNLLDLDISLIKQWFDWKISQSPLYTFHQHYTKIFQFFFSNPSGDEIAEFSKDIGLSFNATENWIHARHYAGRELVEAIQFYKDNFSDLNTVTRASDSNRIDNECDAEVIHVINDDDIESMEGKTEDQISETKLNDSVFVILD